MARLRASLLATACVVLVINTAIWLAGAAPAHVWRLVFEGAVGNPYGLGQTLAKATPLALTGASVAFALRAGLFNIGAEGQLAAGILAAAVVGARLPAATPWFLAIPAAAGAAALAGAGLGALAGWLKGRFGTHEVISTLMLNGLVAVLVTYLYGGPLRVGEQVHTHPVVPGARVPLVDRVLPALRGSALSFALLLAVTAPFVAELYLRRAARGLRIRALGTNAEAARALGIPMTATTTWAMAIAGGLAGLGGVHYVLGAKGYAEDGMGAGVGFAGIAVALLGLGRPAGIVLAAMLLGALGQGGLAVNAIVPADILAVAQAAVLVAVAALGATAWARGQEVRA
jgi:simple sugar transport system permease protein